MRKQPHIHLTSSRPWAPRDALAPHVRRDGNAFVVASNGSPGCYGGWELVYPAVRAGAWVNLQVQARWQNIERSYDSVNVAGVWLDKKENMVGWEPIFPQPGLSNGYVVYQGRMRVPANASILVFKLLMAYSSRGEIRWTSPEVRPMAAPKPRMVRLGAAGGLPPGSTYTVESNTKFYLGLCRQAADKGVDLLCLPEVILHTGMPTTAETLPKLAIPVPGKEIRPFQKFARANRMALCFSVWEKDKKLIYNTALLIDKEGELVGRYRKVHLAQPFEVWYGVTPGHEFSVCDLGWAKVGMNICMDSSAAESARIPARLGAEIICLPIMGDHRAMTSFFETTHDFCVERWVMIQRMRAMDNHVYMVVARNSGLGTGIFGPRGDTLGLSGGCKQVVHTQVDLEDVPLDFLGATFRGVCWYERREPAYGPLVKALLNDPFAK
ncbi:MAG: carbon-nitrogen hydrolase family protein [Kiritimatiellaeota bacterium]|nr:carbon-nitrogen hydrolase family protein [Kiritimatiellota bacterium]